MYIIAVLFDKHTFSPYMYDACNYLAVLLKFVVSSVMYT